MRRILLVLLVGLALATAGCARELPDPRTAHEGFQPWVVPADYAWPPRVVAPEDRTKPGPSVEALTRVHPVTRRDRAPLLSDSVLPGGGECLERLRAHGVPFRPIPESRGVDTPIVVNGPIQGIEFWSPAGPMLVDCRFALGLVQVAPELSRLGIVRVRFSGAYVYRTSRKGRLSLHAYGLALDVHEVTTADGTYSVKRDFVRGLGEACSDDMPLLNRLACRLRAPGLFRELLTPDYNADHHDHLHLGIAPLPVSDGAARTSTAGASPGPSSRSDSKGPRTKGAKKGARSSASAAQPKASRASEAPSRAEPKARRTSASVKVARK